MSGSPPQTREGAEPPAPQEQQEEEEEGDLDDEVDATHLERFLKDGRRTQSLPTYSDPAAGGEGRKRVKFADSMGLTLASVKHFSSLEEPQIPSKVLSRHRSLPPQRQDLLSDLCHRFSTCLDTDRLVACFPELREAERRVRQLRVCLEKITVSRCDVRGEIRVLTRGASKEVGVRYTFNDWLSHADLQAVPVAVGEPDFAGESFVFTVYAPPFMEPGSAVHFAAYLRSEEGEFWDNNEGRNYTLRYRCVPGDTSAASHGT